MSSFSLLPVAASEDMFIWHLGYESKPSMQALQRLKSTLPLIVRVLMVPTTLPAVDGLIVWSNERSLRGSICQACHSLTRLGRQWLNCAL